jgi:hypothetical protein
MSNRRGRSKLLQLRILAAFLAIPLSHAYVIHSVSFANQAKPRDATTRCFNFFEKLNQAFQNDQSLSKDKTKQQYDAPGEEYIETTTEVMTEVQRVWRERQSRIETVTEEQVIDLSLDIDLYLSGVADKDPSNDLYGARINISNRDRSTGLSLPSVPSAMVTVTFLQDGVCQVSSSAFTSDSNCEWKLSQDGKMLRFSMETLGYSRTVETRGSIAVVSWSKEAEKSIDTTTTYSIPPGMVYCDIGVTTSRKQDSLVVSNDSGVVRVEQTSGLFGISSRMVPCGKFIVKRGT